MWKPTNEAGKIHIAYSLTFNEIVLQSPDTKAKCNCIWQLIERKKRNGKRKNEKEQTTTKKTTKNKLKTKKNVLIFLQ